MSRMMGSLLQILGLTLVLQLQHASGQECSTSSIGTDSDTGSVSAGTCFYLNTAYPSDCVGNITSFSYCYYAPSASVRGTNEVYRANFGVYRPSVEGEDTVYTLVSEVFVLERTQSEVDSELNWVNDDDDDDRRRRDVEDHDKVRFKRDDDDDDDDDDSDDDSDDGKYTQSSNCLDFSLTEPVTVNHGDVVGACVFNPSDSGMKRLDIVGSASNSGTLMRRGTSECDNSAVPSSVTLGSLSTGDERILHIYATIEPLPETDPPTTQPVTTTQAPTEAPTTAAPTTNAASTAAPTTNAASTAAPTTNAASTAVPQTEAPKTAVPLTEAPTTAVPMTDTASKSAATTKTEFNSLKSKNGGSIPVIAIIIPALLLILVGILIVLVVIFSLRKYRKKVLVNLTSRGHSVAGFDNMLYPHFTHGGTSEAKGEKLDHGYEMVGDNGSKECTEHTYEEHGFSESHTYADIGPTNEEQVNLYETPMQAMALRSPLDSPAAIMSKNKEDVYEHISPYQAPASRQGDLYGQLKSLGARSIARSEIQIVKHLGSGQFGSVEQGVWKREGTRPVDVALNSLNKTSEEDKVKFLQEAAIMAQFKHPNVIMLYGVVIRGDPVLIVTELAGKGDLRDYLLSLQPKPGELVSISTSKLLLKFSQQIAFGMQYLAAKGFVHRDLAARNVLLTSDNICKISDFGMSRDLEEEKYYVSHGGMVPVKWTAPEAMQYKKYSTASDVWAYGCLLYEIWSLGHKPFEGTRNRDVIRIVNSGERLSPPPGCPKMIYELMSICWYLKTTQRPGFRDIVLILVGSEETVLNIPEEDSSTNPLAGALGAPLEAGENMYSELQRRHL